MGESSKIEWTTHTFNPWIGCMKVSPGCDHCYAESLSKRYGWATWGQRKTATTEPSVGTRKRTSEANWRKPLQWAKTAGAAGERHRVFCASLADVFDNQAPPEWRADLFKLIRQTPELDWLLLTKRPENIKKMLPLDWGGDYANVWLGTTCEDQANYDRRWPILANIPAAIRFISYEPAIGPLDPYGVVVPKGFRTPDWLICGGESGPGARMMDPEWARHARDECEINCTAFFMKQMTAKQPIPDDLFVREFPRNH
jgi:protein gp37